MKKSTIVVTIIIIILIVIALGFGAFLFLNNHNVLDDKEKEEIKYSEEIKIDASLATQPLTDALIDNLTNFNLTANYTNTDPAYTKLINREVDLIVVTEPSSDELKRAEDKNVELEVTPLVNEAFVFFTNINNKVDSLKLEEIQKIYTGEITNWKEVGGRDAKIVAYQRPENSGSQTGMLSLVMKDKKMREPEEREYIETMMGIIDYVSSYENGLDAIGYSYYYYANTMYKNDQMKLLGVNGIKPNNETIKNGEYPLRSAYYMVTLKDNKNETLAKLKEELLGSTGQKIAEEAGYVPIK